MTYLQSFWGLKVVDPGMNESLVGLERHEGEKLITEFRFFG